MRFRKRRVDNQTAGYMGAAETGQRHSHIILSCAEKFYLKKEIIVGKCHYSIFYLKHGGDNNGF